MRANTCCGEARPVIDDVDRDGVLAPARRDRDLARGELGRVLDEVAEPVHDLRAAGDRAARRSALPAASRPARGACRRSRCSARAVRLARRLDQRRERQRREMPAVLAVALVRQLGEDGAAALALAQQQLRVLGIGAVGRQVAHQLLGDDGDGGRAGCRADAPPPRRARPPPRRAARGRAPAGSRRRRRACAAPPRRRPGIAGDEQRSRTPAPIHMPST